MIYQRKITIFATLKHSGVLAQLARALDWQSKGQGFDSLTLHGYFTKRPELLISSGRLF